MSSLRIPVTICGEPGPSHNGQVRARNIHFPPNVPPSLSSSMPSNHHPLDDTQTQIHDLLLGFSTFVVLCGIKSLKMMQQDVAMPKQTRLTNCWSDTEINELLDCLLTYKGKMAEPFNFTTMTLRQAAKALDSGRAESSVSSKFSAVCLNHVCAKS